MSTWLDARDNCMTLSITSESGTVENMIAQPTENIHPSRLFVMSSIIIRITMIHGVIFRFCNYIFFKKVYVIKILQHARGHIQVCSRVYCNIYNYVISILKLTFLNYYYEKPSTICMKVRGGIAQYFYRL